jgi:hypothetical protein
LVDRMLPGTFCSARHRDLRQARSRTTLRAPREPSAAAIHRACSCPRGAVSPPEFGTADAAPSASRRQRRCSTSIRSAACARPRRAYASGATRPAKWRFRGSSRTSTSSAPYGTPAFISEQGAECRKRIPYIHGL